MPESILFKKWCLKTLSIRVEMFGLLRKLENSEPSHKLDYKMYRTVQIDKTLFFIVLTLSKQILPKFVFQRCNQTSD